MTTGVETDSLLGGRWLVSDCKLDVMGRALEGHGISGYGARA